MQTSATVVDMHDLALLLPATEAGLGMAQPAPPAKVPLIREELRLIPAANNADGSPAWMIQDPVSNKFYRIGWLDFELLLRWQLETISDIVQDVNSTTTLEIDEQDVLGLAQFLQQHYLLQANSQQAVANLIKAADMRKQTVWNWLLHHYLFFRIPIIKPQHVLAKAYPLIRWVYSPYTAIAILIITFSGFFLVARQWDVFRTTFLDQLTLSGLFSYTLALMFSKCLHELGHAFTATRYGVRVAHMGIAMLVMFPMPYTDTSESWKLSNARQRLNIASAGIVTELALAGIATLTWSLAPDGAFKNGLFFLATTSWLLTLAVNLSPFMRFDGYFIFSDLMDFPNLHERAGALARVWLRRLLLGFEDAWPEAQPPKKRAWLVAFALGTWLYRLTVFLGIAWLVYYFFFKVLGIILFGVEMLWFVIGPIWNEVKVWVKRRAEIKMNRIFLWLSVFSVLLLLGFVPWQTSVKATGWAHATQQSVIYTPIAGKLVSHHASGAVKKGERLFELTSPDLAIDATRSRALAEASAIEMRGLVGLEDGQAKRANLQYQQEKFNAEVKLYDDELSRMDLLAPFDGDLRDIDDNVATGTWIQPKQSLAVLVDPNSWAVDVFVEERDVARIKVNDAAKIYWMQSHVTVLEGAVTQIDTARVSALPDAALDVQHGGKIATLAGEKMIPSQSMYRVRIQLKAQPPLYRVAMVDARIQTEAKAWLPAMIERVAAVLVRESGF